MVKIDKNKCLGNIEWILSEINDVKLSNEELEIRTLLWKVYDKIKNLE